MLNLVRFVLAGKKLRKKLQNLVANKKVVLKKKIKNKVKKRKSKYFRQTMYKMKKRVIKKIKPMTNKIKLKNYMKKNPKKKVKKKLKRKLRLIFVLPTLSTEMIQDISYQEKSFNIFYVPDSSLFTKVTRLEFHCHSNLSQCIIHCFRKVLLRKTCYIQDQRWCLKKYLLERMDKDKKYGELSKMKWK